MKITIDGKPIKVDKKKTILEACKENGIEIPTLCFQEGFEPSGGCLICVVEIENQKIVPSCATYVSPDMVIWTNTENVNRVRKLSLKLLVSTHWGDCISPCRMKCPGDVDIEGFIRFIKNGDYESAYALITESIPLPSTVGRICPRFCERDCRRNLLEGPLAINDLKRLIGDWALSKNIKEKLKNKENGKRIAIIGGGPAGLSCAYYLRKGGFSVTIFEAEEKLGGMLRMGIPAYRLPKDILDKEIKRILELGIELRANTKVLEDELLRLKNDFDAIFISIGAQESIGIDIPQEEGSNVINGIKLLKDIAKGKMPNLGKEVCVIGGGNTAIDCARSSLRLGVDSVTILYRRGRDEMPALDKEVEEAISEGIDIKFLVIPNRILRDGIECLKAKLGEPDESFRRRPIPIPSSKFKIPSDTIIIAIGQRPDIPYNIKKDKGLIAVDQSLNVFDNVFAGGDCVLGPATAVEAIAQGKKAASSIINYLLKKPLKEEKIYNCVRENFTKGDIISYKEKERTKVIILSPSERKRDFREIEKTIDKEDAKNEVERCLECGCKKEDCLLRKYLGMFDIKNNFKGFIEKKPVDISRPDIKYDPNKCILCGGCVRICQDVKKLGVLGFVGRGYTTQIKPEFGMMLSETRCDGCLECVKVCPTGAFVER